MSKPPPVADVTAFWTNMPPQPSARLEWWKERFAGGWRPNRRISSMGYHGSAEWYGVYIWEYLNVISPFFMRPADPARPMSLIDDINRACEQMASLRSPPCGTKERPHLVSPTTMRTGRGHCVTCGQTFDPDAPPSAANASASDR